MHRTQLDVAEFHQAFEIHIADHPEVPSEFVAKLREDLIREELNELVDAMRNKDLVEIADALGDLLYVVYGAAVSCGIDMEPVLNEIHRSNMSKVGGYKAENGKWIKPATYSPCDLAPVIAMQIP